MKLTIGFSPCPNDTFIFESMINGGVRTNGIDYDVVLEDVETLNEWAISGKLDITKISYGVLPLVLDKYLVLNAGSALGNGVGPLVVSKIKIPVSEITSSFIALPGEHTTAHLLFAMAFPEAKRKVFKRYNEIEDFVLTGESHHTAGVIIHENRFTYQEKGLHALIDLGKYWEETTKLPIPLGGIVVKREIDPAIQLEIQQHIRESISIAWKQYPNLSPFIKQHSQELSDSVIRKHIDLYVNEYSESLGKTGQYAILQLLNIHQKLFADSKQQAAEVFLTDEN